MATTKFKITMEIEVVDVGDVPADVLVLRESIRKSTENISSGNVDVIAIYVEKTGATGVTPKDTRHSQPGNPNWDDNGNKYK